MLHEKIETFQKKVDNRCLISQSDHMTGLVCNIFRAPNPRFLLSFDSSEISGHFSYVNLPSIMYYVRKQENMFTYLVARLTF